MSNKIRIETHTTDIILFDIVGYSLLSDKDQYITIYFINQKLNEFLKLLYGQSFLKTEEVVAGIAPTGDGAYIILDHSIAGYGLLLAISLRSTLLQLKSQLKNLYSGLRIAIHFGNAIPIKDLTGKTNFVGGGLNDCARFLSIDSETIKSQKHLKDKNYIIISTTALSLFMERYSKKASEDFLKVIKLEIGEEVVLTDKHNKEHKVHFIESIRHVAIAPPKPKDIKERMNNLISQHEQDKT